MKLKRNLVFVSLLSALLLLSGCFLNPDDKTLSGTVVLKGTDTPIKGAKVKMVDPVKSSTTDTEGEFSFSKLEKGTYTLVVNKDGFVQNSVSVNVDQDEKITKIELAKEEKSPTDMINDVSTAMYNVGTIYSKESESVNKDITNNVVPYYEAMAPALTNLEKGVFYLEIISYKTPGEYNFTTTGTYETVNTDSDYNNIDKDTWTWTVNDLETGATITYTATDIQSRLDETNYTIDLEGINIDCKVNNNVNYTITTATSAEGATIKEYTIVDGSETFTIKAPIGKIGQVNGTIVHPTDTSKNITIAADFNANQLTDSNEKEFILKGSINSPVLDFTGRLSAVFVGSDLTFDTADNSISMYGNGTLTTNTSEITGDFEALVSNGSMNDITISGSYTSDYAKLNGNYHYEFLNPKTAFEPDNYMKINISYNGQVINLENDESYSVNLVETVPSDRTIKTEVELTHNLIPYLTGEVIQDYSNGEITMHFENHSGATVDIALPPSIDTNIVGTLKTSDGTKKADIKLSETTDALIVVYTDGTSKTLPFDPTNWAK